MRRPRKILLSSSGLLRFADIESAVLLCGMVVLKKSSRNNDALHTPTTRRHPNLPTEAG